MSVCVLSVVILLFEWLYLLLGVEFGKTDTVDRSGMVEIVGNRSDFVEIRSENRWTGQQTNSVRRAVRWVEPGIFCGIFYRLGSTRLNGSNMARVWLSRRLPRGTWENSVEYSGGVCGSPRCPIELMFAAVSSYGWALHGGMIKIGFWQLWKFGYLWKYLCFLTNGAKIPIVGGRNHLWWLWNTRRG
jgi:hypothetical protein